MAVLPKQPCSAANCSIPAATNVHKRRVFIPRTRRAPPISCFHYAVAIFFFFSRVFFFPNLPLLPLTFPLLLILTCSL